MGHTETNCRIMTVNELRRKRLWRILKYFPESTEKRNAENLRIVGPQDENGPGNSEYHGLPPTQQRRLLNNGTVFIRSSMISAQMA